MLLKCLRWTFYKESYIDLTELKFTRHLQAYVLLILGSFLLPSIFGSKVHLQYLPLLEDLDTFNKFSVGEAMLAHLYRVAKEGQHGWLSASAPDLVLGATSC